MINILALFTGRHQDVSSSSRTPTNSNKWFCPNISDTTKSTVSSDNSICMGSTSREKNTQKVSSVTQCSSKIESKLFILFQRASSLNQKKNKAKWKLNSYSHMLFLNPCEKTKIFHWRSDQNWHQRKSIA